ncbi:MAG: helix-turn-helix transcriptional regulator [Alphaproteobacteria bacterium]|nr:helix-turn-helix transcriptional regulator [Alphaproteobacteria bacterium]
MAKDIHPVDVFVGQRLRQRRISLGITQEDMANALGLSFQQVQKYEKGMNRISSSRLWEIGRIVGVEVAYFFEGMNDDIAEIKNLRDDLHARAQVAPTALSARELRLVHHYGEIKDDIIRDGVYSLIRALNLKEGDMDEEAAA